MFDFFQDALDSWKSLREIRMYHAMLMSPPHMANIKTTSANAGTKDEQI